MPSTTPFGHEPVRQSTAVGRARELRLLRDCLGAAIDGQSSLILIGGVAGIGKSTLVEAIGLDAAARSVSVLAGYCYDLSATPPYGPWRSLAPAFGSNGPAIPFPSSLISVEDPPQVASQAALFSEVKEYFIEIASASPVVVVLEDMHWADVASLDLLRSLTRQPGAAPIMAIVTYRVDELTRRHPLYQLLPILVREAAALRLDLRRLETDAMNSLVAERHPMPEPNIARLVAYLQHHAEGNPLYVRELLRTLEDEGVLRPIGGDWVLGDLDHVWVPALIQQVIDGRVERLGEETREALAMAAVIGPDIALDLWSAVSGITEEALVAAVERAVDANLLIASGRSGGVRFAHALIRESIYESILPPRRRIWHRRTAEALVALPGADPDAIAYHFKRAGDARAWEWLVKAGDRAHRTYAWRTAADRFEAAAEALEGTEDHARDRGWLLYRIGRLLRSADPAKGVAYLEEAERLGQSLGDPVLAAYALFDRGTIQCIGGEVARGIVAMESGDRALDALPSDTRSPAEIVAWIADSLPALRRTSRSIAGIELAPDLVHPRRGTLIFWLALAGRFAEAKTIGDDYLARVATVERPGPIVLSSMGDAHFGLGLAASAFGNADLAESHFQDALLAYRAIDHHMLEAVAYDAWLTNVVLHAQSTRTDKRKQLLGEVQSAYERAKGALVAGLATRVLWSYEVHLANGLWSTAREDALNARALGDTTHRFYASAALAHLATLQGDREVAFTLINEVLPNGPATMPGNVRFVEALAMIRYAADLSIDAGELLLGNAWIEAHDRWLAWSGGLRWQPDGLLLWARFHRAAGDPATAASCASDALVRAIELTQPLAQLAAHRLLGELAIERRAWADAEWHLNASLILADDCAAPYERALALLALAELRMQSGERSEVAGYLGEVREICEPLNARPIWSRADALEARLVGTAPARYPAGLSDREVDVLRLVAKGMTNAMVGEALSISPRTVQQHLTNLYSKINVSSRAAATRFAVENGIE